MIAAMIEIVFKSSAVLLITGTAAHLSRRQSASFRHWIWTAGLFGALAVPLLGWVLPAWQIRLPESVVSFSANSSPQQIELSGAGRVHTSAPVKDIQTGGLALSHHLHLEYVWIIWLAGGTIVALLLLIEFSTLMRVAMRSVPVSDRNWQALAAEIRGALVLRRPVKLLRNAKSSVLGTWGTIRPRILLPRESEDWSNERLRAVLSHEMAHVKRNDWLVQIVAEVSRVLFWFNPLFWLACSQLRRESEFACDDAALRLGMDGPNYAEHVLDLVRTLNHSGKSRAAALAMAGTTNLERRLVAMLNPSVNRTAAGKGTAAAIFALASVVTLPLAAMQTKNSAMEKPATLVELQRTSDTELPKTVAATTMLPETKPVRQIAQTPATVPLGNGIIRGTVTDQSGGLLVGVQVTLQNSNALSRASATDRSGTFTFPQLAPGDYIIRMQYPNFRSSVSGPIPVLAGSQTNTRTTLQLGLSTSVEVSAESPVPITPPRPSTTVSEPFGDFDNNSTRVVSTVPLPQPTATDGAVANRTPLRIGGDVQGGPMQYAPKPAFPDSARLMGMEGTAVLSAIIGADGHIKDVRVVSTTDSVFSDPALQAVQNWVYRSTLLNNQATEIVTTITVNFRLQSR